MGVQTKGSKLLLVMSVLLGIIGLIGAILSILQPLKNPDIFNHFPENWRIWVWVAYGVALLINVLRILCGYHGYKAYVNVFGTSECKKYAYGILIIHGGLILVTTLAKKQVPNEILSLIFPILYLFGLSKNQQIEDSYEYYE